MVDILSTTHGEGLAFSEVPKTRKKARSVLDGERREKIWEGKGAHKFALTGEKMGNEWACIVSWSDETFASHISKFGYALHLVGPAKGMNQSKMSQRQEKGRWN